MNRKFFVCLCAVIMILPTFCCFAENLNNQPVAKQNNNPTILNRNTYIPQGYNLQYLGELIQDHYIGGDGRIYALKGTSYIKIPVIGFDAISLTLNQKNKAISGQFLFLDESDKTLADYSPASCRNADDFNESPVYTLTVPEKAIWFCSNYHITAFDGTKSFLCVKGPNIYACSTNNMFNTENSILIIGKYIDSDGNIKKYTNAKYAKVPVSEGFEFSFSINIPNKNYVGQILFFDKDDNIIAGYQASECITNYLFHYSPIYTLTVPMSATKIGINVKMGSFDASDTLIIKNGGIECWEARTANSYSVLFGKRIALIGDSITEYNFRAKAPFGTYLEDWTGCIVQNLGVAGMGFSTKPSYKYIDQIPKIDPRTDVIGVATSINDCYAIEQEKIQLGTVDDTESDKTVFGYVDTFFKTLISEFPTTPIICYVECPSEDYQYKHGMKRGDAYISGIRIICQKYSIPFYDDLYTSGSVLRPWIHENRLKYFTSDNDHLGNTGIEDTIHPNSEGMKVIAMRLLPHFEENIIPSQDE